VNRRTRNVLGVVACVIVLLPRTLVAAEWYVSYEKGLDAVRGQRWEEAVNLLNDAISEKPQPRANAKTYGLRFIDYFPYVYRGVAYYHLGNNAKAFQDLERENSYGEVFNGSKDKDAQRILAEHLNVLKTKSQADNKLAEVKKLYDQKEYKKVIEVSQSLPKNSPRYADIAKYAALAENELKRIESPESVKKPEVAASGKGKKELVDTEFNEGVRFFKRQEFQKAEERFTAVLQMDNNNAKAKDYLNKIRTMREKLVAASKPETYASSTTETPVTPEKTAAQKELDAVFNEGVELFNKGKIEKARSKFLLVRQRDASYPDAENYLAKVTRIQETTRTGITAFFEGQYQQSIDQLAEASKSNADNANVYAFLACSYAAKYFLTGGEDKNLYQNALNAFNKVKEVNSSYKLDSKYISPKIIAMLNGR